jgi:hypothetical protein
MFSRSSFAAVAACTLFSSGALAQSAKEIVGTTPWETVDNEPPAKLIVDPPLAEPLSRGAAVIQYRTENFRIVPEVGATAVGVSPRIGHLHVTVDDLPWHWADAATGNTIVVVGLPAGPHKIRIELADPTHRVLTGQTISFVIPATGAGAPMH